MFQNSRPRHGSLFGHMSYDKNRSAKALCKLQKNIRCLPDLGNAAGSGRNGVLVHRLDRIDDRNIRHQMPDILFDGIQIGLTE